MSTNIMLQLRVFAVDPTSKRLIANQMSLVPGNNILDYTQSIAASGSASLGALAANTIIMLSTTPVVSQNYVTNAGNVIAPTASPYAQPSAQVPVVDVTFDLVGGGVVTLQGVQSLVVVPMNVTGVTITNTTSASIDMHVVQSTS